MRICKNYIWTEESSGFWLVALGNTSLGSPQILLIIDWPVAHYRNSPKLPQSFAPQSFYESTEMATLDGAGRMRSAQTSESSQEEPLHKSPGLPEEPFQYQSSLPMFEDAVPRCSGTGPFCPSTVPRGHCACFSRALHTVATNCGCSTFCKPFESKTKKTKKKNKKNPNSSVGKTFVIFPFD